MLSKFFITNLSKPETISLKNNQKANIYIVANGAENCNKELEVILQSKAEANLYVLVIGNANQKFFNFKFNHIGNNAKSNIYVKALASHKALIKIDCNSKIKEGSHKNEVSQTIDGLIFDNESQIQALPCLDIDTDDITAKHTVNIGQIDPEIIFYLNTKGLSNLQAYQFLIDSFINDLTPYLLTHNVNISREIKRLLEANYE